MSSFICPHCQKHIIEDEGKDITGCEHYPLEGKPMSEDTSVEELLDEVNRYFEDNKNCSNVYDYQEYRNDRLLKKVQQFLSTRTPPMPLESHCVVTKEFVQKVEAANRSPNETAKEILLNEAVAMLKASE